MSVKIGVVGLGIGGLHVDSLSKIPNAEMVAFADLDPVKVQKFASEHGGRAYADWQAMLDGESDLDAVVLATPAHVRLEPITAICERGIALFCEKPPAVNLEAAHRVRAVVEAAGNLNAVGFMYRWSPLADRMRTLIEGRPRLFARGVVAWPVLDWAINRNAPKSLLLHSGCGGPLIEQAIHYQDVLRYITGDEPTLVHAIAELGTQFSQEGRDCEETTAYLLRHESGMLSTHVHNWSHMGTVMEIQVVGDTYDLTWHMTHNEMRFSGTLDGEKINEECGSEYYFDEMVGFVNAVEAKDQSIIRSTYADACKSLAVCEAATSAVKSGGPVAIAL